MGKKDKKKKGLGKAKTEAREAKKADKARRKAAAAAGDDDVEAVLAAILAKEEADAAVTAVPDAEPPSPRTAFTMVASTVADSDLVLFGGEHFTGERGRFFNETFLFNVEKKTWTRFDSSTRPPPRSGHAACTYKNFMFVFGGEFGNPSLRSYRHYRDLWRLDLTDMAWEKMDLRGGPSSRSGHRMCVVKNKLVVFGGYVDPGYGDNHYLNDMSFIDLSQVEYEWTRVMTSAVDVVPSPRSGFQWAVFGDEAWLYGGYCREAASKAGASSHKTQKKGGANASEEAMVARGIVHSDMFKLNGDSLKWQKVKRNGYGPSNRSGFALAVHKRAFVLFGGVEDDETEEDLSSVFYNDLFGFNVDRKRWYPMTIRKRKAKGSGGSRRRRKKQADIDGEEAESGNSSAQTTPCAVADDDEKERGQDEHEEEEEDDEAEIDAAALEAAMKKAEEEEQVPSGRFNSACAVQRNILYIAAGVVEKKDADVTLDDIWAVDLNKLEQFVPVKPLSDACAEWVASEEENDEDDEDEDEDEDNDEDDMDMDEEDGGVEDESKRRRERKKRLEERMAEVEDMMMPRVFEPLKDYHDRTKAHWYGMVHEALGESGKGLRRIAFEWAYKRYFEVRPSLVELEEIEAELAEEAKLEEAFEKAQVDERRGRSRR